MCDVESETWRVDSVQCRQCWVIFTPGWQLCDCPLERIPKGWTCYKTISPFPPGFKFEPWYLWEMNLPPICRLRGYRVVLRDGGVIPPNLEATTLEKGCELEKVLVG